MKIYDITMEIHNDMAVWKNRAAKKPQIGFVARMPKDVINESEIHMNLHIGTHIDAPFHILADGKKLEEISLKKLVVPCKVLELTHVKERITQADLEKENIVAGDFILFKTVNSWTDDFSMDFVFLEQGGAEYLAKIGVVGVGIDEQGIERDQAGHPTHKILLTEGIVIIEGLRLKDVAAGEYLLCALPLKIRGVDGAPARVILMEKEKIV